MVSAAAALALAACGGGGGTSAPSNPNCPATSGRIPLSTYGGGGSGSGQNTCPSPTPAPKTSAAPVGLLLTGESAVATTSDGTVLGFFNGTTGSVPNGSEVVTLTANTNVQFINTEAATGLPHTASFLGAYSGSYPGTFTNTNGPVASPAGTVISSPNFSAGNLNPGDKSAIYKTGGPGMFIFGCAYHYVSNGMRTVIVVM
jgi:hypothetical protein